MTGDCDNARGPIVQKGITTGNVLSMITTAIGGLGIVVAVTTSYSNANKDIQTNAREISLMKASIDGARAAIRQLEISEARSAERFDSILRNMNEVKTQLREVSEILRDSGDPPKRN